MHARRPARTVTGWLAAGTGLAAAAAAGYAACVVVAWRRYGHAPPSSRDEVDTLLDQFMPRYDVALRHDVRVAAPAPVTFRAASEFEIQSPAVVRALFRARAVLLGSDTEAETRPRPLLAWMRSIGWVLLADVPERAVVLGTMSRAWEATPTPRTAVPSEFAAFAEPGYVKIATAWAAGLVGPSAATLTLRTRVTSTDATARRLFRRYWAALAEPGSLLIRYVALGLVKREAERQARASGQAAEASASRSRPTGARTRAVPQPQAIAEGVYCLEAGKGIMRSNVYFVRSGPTWVLIDTGTATCDRAIQEAAESLFGASSPPAAILLTHDHPDHAGSTAELARRWGTPVYLHPDELPLVTMDYSAYLPTVERFAHPLDTWIVLPMLRVMPRRWREALHAEATSFKDAARAFNPGAGVPGLPDWECIPTPGHTPGHVSFFRASDRVLITGDAVLTVHLNSVWGFLLWALGRSKPGLSGPPWYTTWRWQVAKKSVATLARLEPRVLACGHGSPMSGAETAGALHAFAERFASPTLAATREPVRV